MNKTLAITTIALVAFVLGTVSPAFAVDTDSDGIDDAIDNCPLIANQLQTDTDEDGTGDVCDDLFDVDGDIKPGDVFVIDDDPLNCDNKGVSQGKSVVPIGIFAGKIDITTILHTGVTINEVAQTEKHGMVHLEDLDEDEIPDIAVLHLIARDVCEVDVIEGAAKKVVVDVTISGTTTGDPWTFDDSIKVVKPCPGNDCVANGASGGGLDKEAKEIAKADKNLTKIDGKDWSQDKKCEKVLKLEVKLAKKGYHSDTVHGYLAANCGHV